MADSFSESDACGNDWDNTWVPSTRSESEPSDLPFCWKSPWKNVNVILVDHSGQREKLSDETGCFLPVKFQYLITHRLHQLQTVIHRIQSLNVKNIQTGEELLEITTKTDVHVGAGDEIATVLSNELEDIYLKMIKRFPFTCSIIEGLFKGKMDIMMIRDETRVYVVGPLTCKTLICRTIDQFNNLISRETISFDEKWKRVAVGYLKTVPFLLQQYPNVSISTKEDAKEIFIQGTKSDVRNAVKKLHDVVSSVHVDHIHLGCLVVKLLLRPDASSLLSAILESQQIDASWTIDRENLIIISKETIAVGSVKQVIAENFVSAGFSAEAFGNKNVDRIPDMVHRIGKALLVVEKEQTGYRVASTKANMRSLLQQEHSVKNMVHEYVQVNEIDDEINELHKNLGSIEKRLQNVKEENIKNQKEKEVLQTEVESLMQKNKSLENQIRDLELHSQLKEKHNWSTSIEPQLKFTTPEGLDVLVYVGNILNLNVDCIVNAANGNLNHGGGIAEVISRAAGYGFQQESDDYISQHGNLHVTECCTTSAGNLPYKCVIHAVGPRWCDYPDDKRQCAKDLELTILNCLFEANRNQLQTIAIPAISSGIFGVQKDVCCKQYCEAVIYFSRNRGQTTSLKEIHLSDKDTTIINKIQDELKARLVVTGSIASPSLGSLASSPSGADGHTTPFATFASSFPRSMKHRGQFGEKRNSTGSSSLKDGGDGTKQLSKAKLGTTVKDEKLDDCVICIDTLFDPRKLKCGHLFCNHCISHHFEVNYPKCPICGFILGQITGDQPPGTMTVHKSPLSLEGYKGYGRIEINYNIPAGRQGPEHITPGEPYESKERSGYLPDNEKGRLVAKLLMVAFNRRLIFTIGYSLTTRKTGVVTWNDIRHKTNPKPFTEYGYPDPGYLDKVLGDLAAKGVTEDDVL